MASEGTGGVAVGYLPRLVRIGLSTVYTQQNGTHSNANWFVLAVLFCVIKVNYSK